MRGEETPSDGPVENYPEERSPEQNSPDRGPPDVEINASVNAREVIFRRVPDVRTAFGRDGETGIDSGRRNLPGRVEPGLTHRGVRAFYRAVSRPPPQPSRRKDGPTRGDRPEPRS